MTFCKPKLATFHDNYWAMVHGPIIACYKWGIQNHPGSQQLLNTISCRSEADETKKLLRIDQKTKTPTPNEENIRKHKCYMENNYHITYTDHQKITIDFWICGDDVLGRALP